MARTTKALITRAIRELQPVAVEGFVSQGEFYAKAKEFGYSGTQTDLILRANELAEKGYLETTTMGMHSHTCFRLVSPETRWVKDLDATTRSDAPYELPIFGGRGSDSVRQRFEEEFAN